MTMLDRPHAFPSVVEDRLTEPVAAEGLMLTDVVRRYSAFTLGPVTTSIAAGEITGLIGSNGAGKTTLLRLLACQDTPQGGEILRPATLDGDAMALARVIGFATDESDMPGDLTAREMWRLITMLAYRSRSERSSVAQLADALADYFEFFQHDQLIRTLSHGNTQKVKLIAALLGWPPILLLDEPRNGLDPVAIARLESLLAAYATSGRAVVIATHDLHYAERSSTRILALQRGHIVFDGFHEELPGDVSFPDWYLSVAMGGVRNEDLR